MIARKQKIAAVFLMLVSPFCGQAQQTRLLTADKHNEYGLVYTLPVTTLEIEVTATRTVNKAGPYFRYAKKFIGTDNVIKEDTESWTITDVKMKSYGVPDTGSRYLMQLKSGALTYICVDENGMLLAINREVAPEKDAHMAKSQTSGASPEEKVGLKDYLQYVNEDFIASQSSAKQAQMLAESLMEVRDARISLTRGTAETMPTDGRQLELMLNSLARQEAAFTAAFRGLSETTQEVRRFTFTPEEDGRKILFRMSDFSGFVAADDYSGDPVYISVDVTTRGEMPVDAKGEEKKLPKDAVIYNLPGEARITVSSLGKTLCEKDMEFSQFGVRFGLSPSLFSSKKDRSFAIFDPATGAIREIGEDAGE